MSFRITIKKVQQNVLKIVKKLSEAVKLCPDQNLYCLLHRFRRLHNEPRLRSSSGHCASKLKNIRTFSTHPFLILNLSGQHITQHVEEPPRHMLHFIVKNRGLKSK